jgi:hypothetical protein
MTYDSINTSPIDSDALGTYCYSNDGKSCLLNYGLSCELSTGYMCTTDDEITL